VPQTAAADPGWLSGHYSGQPGGVACQPGGAGWVAPVPDGSFSYVTVPPVPLTAASTAVTTSTIPKLNGTYTVIRSSQWAPDTSGSAYYTFSSAANAWCSETPSYTTTGAYTGAYSCKLADGSAYAGEWIGLQLPHAVVAHAYTITMPVGYTTRTPHKFAFLGSADGVTWTKLDDRDAVSWSQDGLSRTFAVSNASASAAFTQFCVAVNAILGGGTGYVSVGKLSITASIGSDAASATLHGADEWVVSCAQKGAYRSNGLQRAGKTYGSFVPSPDVQALTAANFVTVNSLPYQNGGFVFSASSEQDPVNYPACKAFDGLLSTWWESYQNYNTTTGVYTGSATTTLSDLTTVAGEWLQLQLPAPVAVRGYLITSRVGYVAYRAPKTFKLLGSATGADGSWSIVDSQSGISDYLASTPWTFTIATSQQAYMFYRLATSLINAAGADHSCVDISSFTLIESENVSDCRASNALPYPSAAVQSLVVSNSVIANGQVYGNGVYNFSCSSMFTTGGSRDAFCAFNSSTTDYWATLRNYDATTGFYTGPFTTTLADGVTFLKGEWLQIKMPSPIALVAYTIVGAREGLASSRSPRSFDVLGSNDGVSWILVDTQPSATEWVATVGKGFTIATTAAAYSYYRLVIKTIGADTNAYRVELINWSLFEATPSSTYLCPIFPPPAVRAITTDNCSACLSSLSYSNGPHYFSSSSENADGSSAAWRAFSSSSATNAWASRDASYAATTGAYAGSVSTKLADGTSVAGEWLQASFPGQFFVQSYILTPTSSPTLSPSAFKVLGSADRETWYVLDSQSSLVWTASTPKTFALPGGPHATPYAFYRLVVTAGGTNSSGTSVALGALSFQGVPCGDSSDFVRAAPGGRGQVPSAAVQALITADVISVAPSAAGNNGRDAGVWQFSGSTLYGGGVLLPSKAFTATTTDFWSPTDSTAAYLYSTTTGLYSTTSGSSTLLASGTTVFGEWLQAKMPSPLAIKSYTITPRATFGTTRSPRTFKMLGSNTGAAGDWHVVDDRVSLTDWTDAARTFTVPTSTVAYVAFVYYRIVITAVGNTGGANTICPNMRMFLTEADAAAFPEYPPTGVQALAVSNAPAAVTNQGPYGHNGVWVYSASSEAGEPYPAYFAFDGNASTFWHSQYIQVPNRLYVSGEYNVLAGRESTLVNAATKYGEWLQVKMPAAVPIRGYNLQGMLESYMSRSPRNFSILGSNDGTTWAVVDERSNINDWTASVRTFTLTQASAAYSYYRIVVASVGNAGFQDAGANTVQIATWTLVRADAAIATALSYPSGAMRELVKGNQKTVSGQPYGNGSWVFSASSSYDATAYPYNAFGPGSLAGALAIHWHSSSSNAYNAYSFVYNSDPARASTTSATDGAVHYGEWLQVAMPDKVFPQAYTILPRQDNSWYAARSPRDWVILASTDGSSWVPIDVRAGINNWTLTAKTFTISPVYSNIPFNYYRIVVKAVGNSGSSALEAVSVQIASFELAALPLPPLATPLSSALSVNGLASEASDWALSELLIYNRHLSGPEVLQVEDYLMRRHLGVAGPYTAAASSTVAVPVSYSELAARYGIAGPFSASAMRARAAFIPARTTGGVTVPSSGEVGTRTLQGGYTDPLLMRLDASYLNRARGMVAEQTVATWYDTLNVYNAVGFGSPKLKQATYDRGGYWYVDFSRASSQYFALGEQRNDAAEVRGQREWLHGRDSRGHAR
jgi:hypothetical protein